MQVFCSLFCSPSTLSLSQSSLLHPLYQITSYEIQNIHMHMCAFLVMEHGDAYLKFILSRKLLGLKCIIAAWKFISQFYSSHPFTTKHHRTHCLVSFLDI